MVAWKQVLSRRCHLRCGSSTPFMHIHCATGKPFTASNLSAPCINMTLDWNLTWQQELEGCVHRLQIGALLGQEAPGNLGKSALEGLPSRFGPSSFEGHHDVVDLTDSPAGLGTRPSNISPAPGQPAIRGNLTFPSLSSSNHEQRSPATRASGTACGQTPPAARSVAWTVKFCRLLPCGWECGARVDLPICHVLD